VDKAQASPYPVSPNTRMIYLVAIFASFASAVALVSFRELFSSKIFIPTGLEKLTSFLSLAK
jgi:uncharacterized protein involved in exopolysaccharide biosynthesis